MSGRKKALKNDVIPACAAFFRALLEVPGTRDLVAAKYIESRTATAAKTAPKNQQKTVVAWLRRFIRKTNASYPTAETCWKLSAPLRAIGYGWVAGPVMLYATGHLVEFVHIIALADRTKLDLDERLANIEEIIRYAPLRSVKRKITERVAKGEKITESENVQIAEAERVHALWSLSAEQNRVFETAWNRYKRNEPLPDDHPIQAALIMAAAEGSLETRRWAIVDFLRWSLQSDETNTA